MTAAEMHAAAIKAGEAAQARYAERRRVVRAQAEAAEAERMAAAPLEPPADAEEGRE